MHNHLKIAIATLAIAATTPFVADAATVRSINADKVSDKNLIIPESFETDTQKMMQNWYLKNYARIDHKADSRPDVKATDEEIIARLQALPTTIEMTYNPAVRSFINLYVERKKSLVESMLGMSLYYMPIFEQALDKYNMPMELRYLPVIESALNPTAVSKAGATGLWQFMLGTATGLGLEVNSLVDERRDPYISSDAGARYLKQLYDMYGDWTLAIAAYNCGPGNVNKALRRAGGGKKDFWDIYNYLPSETRSYVPAFIAANYAMNYYDKHNISPALAAKPIITDTVHVNARVHFSQISEVLDIPIDELRALNPQYRQDIIPGDIKPYALVLPNMQALCFIANQDSIINHNAERYARRSVVEPGQSNAKSDGSKENGEYVTETVTKYHKVKQGETLSSIARTYGVTTSSIRQHNGISRKVRNGQTLKIVTTSRRFVASKANDDGKEVAVNTPEDNSASTPGSVPPPPAKPAAEAKEVPAPKKDNTPATNPVPESKPVAETKPAKKEEKKPAETKPAAKPAAKTKPAPAPKPKTTTHNIAAGDNLTSIARKYGVTVEDLKKANNMKGDNIRAGQTLTVPVKSKATNSSKNSKSTKSASKSRKRR